MANNNRLEISVQNQYVLVLYWNFYVLIDYFGAVITTWHIHIIILGRINPYEKRKVPSWQLYPRPELVTVVDIRYYLELWKYLWIWL